MDASAIRSYFDNCDTSVSLVSLAKLQVLALAEIAAQLAELNHNLTNEQVTLAVNTYAVKQ